MAHSPVVTNFSVLSILLLSPPFLILLWYTMVHSDGSVMKTWDYLRQHGLLQGMINIWPKPTAIAWKIIFCFVTFEAVLQLLLPGKRVEGPISPAGNVPVYKANCLAAFGVTLITYLGLWWFGIFNPTIVYDHLGEIISALIFGGHIFCILLYIKGHVAPSSTDFGSSGNVLMDYYWGMELYPRIGKFDIKLAGFRFELTAWALLALTFCIKQYETNGRVSDSLAVSATLMLIYVTKNFWSEAAYLSGMDLAHDRAGAYLCLGFTLWVPNVYSSPALYLVNHPHDLGLQPAFCILVCGILCLYIIHDCDRQRHVFRSTNGKCLIWGQAPSKIVASYKTSKGETKTSLLLISGWWGLSHHFNYIADLLVVFFWTSPALFGHFVPYFSLVFQILLLFDRAKRDDDRCRSKYGKYWEMYCEKVPYLIIPGIY